MQTLEEAPGRTERKLMDDLDEFQAFAKHILNKSKLAWSIHAGGGNVYKATLFYHSNAAMMSLDRVDKLKVELLSSKTFLYLTATCN